MSNKSKKIFGESVIAILIIGVVICAIFGYGFYAAFIKDDDENSNPKSFIKSSGSCR